MPNTAIQTELSDKGVHGYGSLETERFEGQLARYFGREYTRWHRKNDLPEKYGISSFKGNMTTSATRENLLRQHYDDQLRIFKIFLDSDYLAYTMAYYGEKPGEAKSACLSLIDAQRNKYQLIVERAQIEDGQNILDLGCGFGGFSKYLLEQFEHVTITGINPSHVQTNYIRDCVKLAEHPLSTKRFKLTEAFFDEVNDAHLCSAKFDRVVCLGLLEHINNMEALFEKIASVLEPGGKCFQHCIVSIPTIPKLLDPASTLIGTYFPGGRIWPSTEPLRHNTYLEPTNSWFVNGLNYWRTLDSWHQRFWQSVDQLYPAFISQDEIEAWNRYFSLCKAMFLPFDGAMYGNGHYLYEN